MQPRRASLTDIEDSISCACQSRIISIIRESGNAAEHPSQAGSYFFVPMRLMREGCALTVAGWTAFTACSSLIKRTRCLTMTA